MGNEPHANIFQQNNRFDIGCICLLVVCLLVHRSVTLERPRRPYVHSWRLLVVMLYPTVRMQTIYKLLSSLMFYLVYNLVECTIHNITLINKLHGLLLRYSVVMYCNIFSSSCCIYNFKRSIFSSFLVKECNNSLRSYIMYIHIIPTMITIHIFLSNDVQWRCIHINLKYREHQNGSTKRYFGIYELCCFNNAMLSNT